MSELFESRKQFLKNLVMLLDSDTKMIDESLSISIDAGWGFGKSFFLKKLADRLKTDGHMVIYYNAWETDLSNDAFVSFADSLFIHLSNYIDDTTEFFEKANLAMIAFGSLMLDKFVSGLPFVGELKRTISETRKKYKKLVEKEGSYFVKGNTKSGLELVKEKVDESLDIFFSKLKKQYEGKHVVVLVDELDRCRPDYSIQVLERVKHLFGDNRLSFVFAINKDELEKSIQQTYGSIDVSVYFEKFFSFSFRLPQIDIDSFISEDIGFVDENEKHKVYFELLCQMVKDAKPYISLRQVERIFNYFEAVCRVVKDFDSFTSAPYLIPIAIFSKVLDSGFFYNVFEKRKLSNYYSPFGNQNSYFKSAVYDKFRSYNLDGGSEESALLKIMTLSERLSVSRNLFYSSGGKRVNICNNLSLPIVKSDSIEFFKIYSVVDCLI